MDTSADHQGEAENQLRGAYNSTEDENERQCLMRAQTHALIAIAGSLEALARHHTGEASPNPAAWHLSQ